MHTLAFLLLSAQPTAPNPTWASLVSKAELGRDKEYSRSRTDISSCAPPTKLPGKTLLPVCTTSASALVTVTVPGSWQGYPGQEGASVRAGQQAWFWLGRKAGNCPA